MTGIVLAGDAIASRQKVSSEARDREERLERGIEVASVAEIAKPRGDVVLGALCGPVDSRRIATTTVAAEEALVIIAATAHGAPTIPIGIARVAGVTEAIVSAMRRTVVRETFSCLPQPFVRGPTSPPTTNHRIKGRVCHAHRLLAKVRPTVRIGIFLIIRVAQVLRRRLPAATEPIVQVPHRHRRVGRVLLQVVVRGLTDHAAALLGKAGAPGRRPGEGARSRSRRGPPSTTGHDGSNIR
mmetsp:Transcript_26205/g.61221  ORF Transcript_26205/g.61221 Transcript_26205/m.61221 type:complete len:241 (+) Transcript_26205:2782-3504(+)